MFRATHPALHHGVARVKVRPMGGDVEAADFGGNQGMLVRLGRSQGAGGIQLTKVIFEHTFNIRITIEGMAVILARRQQRTTHHQSGQHLSAERRRNCNLDRATATAMITALSETAAVR